MTLEQRKILSDFAGMLSSLDADAYPRECEAMLAAVAEIDRLQERERVLADGLMGAKRLCRSEFDYENVDVRSANTRFSAALRLLDDSDGARLTPATGKGAA